MKTIYFLSLLLIPTFCLAKDIPEKYQLEALSERYNTQQSLLDKKEILGKWILIEDNESVMDGDKIVEEKTSFDLKGIKGPHREVIRWEIQESTSLSSNSVDLEIHGNDDQADIPDYKLDVILQQKYLMFLIVRGNSKLNNQCKITAPEEMICISLFSSPQEQSISLLVFKKVK